MKFEFLGASHWIVLALTAALSVAAAFFARRYAGTALPRRIGVALGLVLIGTHLAYNFYRVRLGTWELRCDLPMQFCDWAGIAIIVALLTRRQFWFELAYFWVIAGSLQALITPNLERDFPDFFFFTFMISHATLVVSSAYFLFGLRMRPLPGSVVRVFLAGQVYLVVAMAFNFALDANYGFLMEKPGAGSLMDALGPWPWYILAIEGLGLFAFVLLYAPFYFSDRSRWATRG